MNTSWFGVAVMVASCWICAAGFLAFGLFARHHKKPVWFWSGSTVDPASISDIPAYNRANSRMWIAFSLPFWAGGLLSFWKMIPAAVVVTAACLIGIPALIIVYQRILRKYKITDYE